jgi:hypothetical protein
MKPIIKNIISITLESISREQKSKSLRALDRVKKLARQTNSFQYILISFDGNGDMSFSESDKMIHVKDSHVM